MGAGAACVLMVGTRPGTAGNRTAIPLLLACGEEAAQAWRKRKGGRIHGGGCLETTSPDPLALCSLFALEVSAALFGKSDASAPAHHLASGAPERRGVIGMEWAVISQRLVVPPYSRGETDPLSLPGPVCGVLRP